MKEFWIYTGLRVLLFVATLAVVFGVWLLLSDEVPVLWAVVVAFAISGLASYFLLERSRQAFARKVEGRAERVSAAFEAQRSKEDVDDDTP